MNALLVVEGLAKAYVDGNARREVLHGLSMVVQPGEVVALCGPSGSGKTTLLNLVAGLLEPDAGRVRLDTTEGERWIAPAAPSARTAVRRRHMGYVFQFFNLVPTLTVRENVLLPLELTRRQGLAERALARLHALGLGDLEDQFPDQLSGGERQRTAIARALAHEPCLVLADEPTGNLDRDNAARVVDLLWQEVRSLNSALLVATHDPVVADRADRVVGFGQ
jgi:putative ABC transport system ATP-binding protein